MHAQVGDPHMFMHAWLVLLPCATATTRLAAPDCADARFESWAEHCGLHACSLWLHIPGAFNGKHVDAFTEGTWHVAYLHAANMADRNPNTFGGCLAAGMVVMHGGHERPDQAA